MKCYATTFEGTKGTKSSVSFVISWLLLVFSKGKEVASIIDLSHTNTLVFNVA